MKKILLIGIGGVYNYGCEAIIRGTTNIIHQNIPDATIDYASYRVEDDKRRLEGCNIRIITRPFKRYSLKNIFRKLLTLAGIYISYDSYSLIKDYNAVFSVGGDIYTLSPDGEIPYSLMKFGEMCVKKGIPYILWCCSIGPFGNNNYALKEMQKHLSNISLIVAREEITIDFLKKIGNQNNVVFAPDPAFYVAPEIRKHLFSNNRIKKIAINLSPLSVEYLKMRSYEAIDIQTRTITTIIDEFNADILLVPHVICDFNEKDDDYRYLENIKSNIPLSYRDRVSIVQKNIGYINTKKELISCDIAIAARMHCAINAVTAGIPTLFLSYSDKAKGMAKFIYGDYLYAIGLNDFFELKHYEILTNLFTFFNRNREKILDEIQIENNYKDVFSKIKLKP